MGLSLEDVPELVEDDEGRLDAVARVDRAIDALNLVIARHPLLHPPPPAPDGWGGGPGGGPRTPGRGVLGIHAVIDLETDLEGGAEMLRCLPPDRRSDILFIVREALSNVARHSGASQAAVVLALDEGDLVVCVEDNGRGFDPALVPGPDTLGRHQGLSNMRDRAIGMGGTFAIERPDGAGTRIIVRVPASSGDAGSALPYPPETTDRD